MIFAANLYLSILFWSSDILNECCHFCFYKKYGSIFYENYNFFRFEGMEDERETITKNFKDVEKGVEQLFRDIYEVS